MAIKYMTPVIVLSDGYLANSSEPFKIPDVSDLPKFKAEFYTNPVGFSPYQRDPETLARPWVRPGTPQMQHRIGGLEKDSDTGAVSYDPKNHEKMVRLRSEKIEKIGKELPPIDIVGDTEGDLLILSWGSGAGSVRAAIEDLRGHGWKVGGAHLRYLYPMQAEVPDVLKRYKHVLIPEMNLGQMRFIIRARFGIDAIGLNMVQGRPIRVDHIVNKAYEILGA
jgi:2-oxoglutarate/2-oxoacid ferredoxin oxidoreductase subunit alpha